MQHDKKLKSILKCKTKRHYLNYNDAYKAMIGTNLKYKTKCSIYSCPICKLLSIGHKRINQKNNNLINKNKENY